MHMRRTAFTIIELLVVISIIGLLTAVATTSYNNAQRSSRDSARKTTVNSIATAVETYYRDKHAFPGNANLASTNNACEKIDPSVGGIPSDNAVSYSYVPKRICTGAPYVAATDLTPTWIPGLGAYMSSAPIDKRFLDANGDSFDAIMNRGAVYSPGEVWTAYDGSADTTRTYTYRHIKGPAGTNPFDGYVVYTRLESASPDTVAAPLTDSNVAILVNNDPTKDGSNQNINGNVYAVRR